MPISFRGIMTLRGEREGVVHQVVDSPEMLGRSVDKVFTEILIFEISDPSVNLVPLGVKFVGEILGFRIEISEAYRRAFATELLENASTDSTGSASN